MTGQNFQEVMRQAVRMCAAEGAPEKQCEDCPVTKCEDAFCLLYDGSDATNVQIQLFERLVMDWAAKHPEPLYQTWTEWQEENFPNKSKHIQPCMFASSEEMHCNEVSDCYKCRERPIPAGIAVKLGAKLKRGERQ